MILRRLKQEEHGVTRALWEEVFQEDTKEFLDYYYFIKTQNNEIYVIEEDGKIRSMLQLNPYEIQIEEKKVPSCYIIAVATQKEYRSRGYMGELLRTSMADMYARKIPFTFLMPAAEAIYTPYDFRYIYSQCQKELSGRSADDSGALTQAEDAAAAELADARLMDAEAMAEFFQEHFAHMWQVASVRDAQYYRTMILEQQSEHGGVMLMKADGKISGMFPYASEGDFEIREPLLMEGYERAFLKAAEELSGGRNTKVYAAPKWMDPEEKPLIMARLLFLPAFFGVMKAEEEAELDCSFAVIDPIIRQNSRIWRLQSAAGETEIHVRETEDSEGVLPVAELTEFLFGRIDIETLRAREGVILTDRLMVQFGMIKPLQHVFLNEVV